MFATFPRYPVTGQFVIFEFHTWYMSHMIHLVHGAGIFTYMNGWFLWDQCRWIFQAPWILWLLWMLCVMKSLWNILTWSLTVRPPKGKTNASQPSFVQGFLLLDFWGVLSYSVCLMYQGIGRDVPRSQRGPPMGNPYITWVFMGCNLLNPYRTQQIPLGYLYVRGIPVLVPWM